MKLNKGNHLDPLFVIFEQHLFNFQDSEEDRKTFINCVADDYLTFLRKKNIAVPRSLEHEIRTELAEQVNTMLVKKIYGCLSIVEYQKRLPQVEKKRARSRYAKLNRG